MKVPNTKFEKCADPKGGRPNLREPWLDVDKERLVATNGHVMVVIPVEVDENDVTGHVPMDAVKAARKVTKHDPELYMEAKHANAYGGRYPRGDLGKYPDVDQIIEPLPKGEGEADIVLDAKMLYDLAQALMTCKTTESARVRLYFKRDEKGDVDKTSAIRVEPMGPNVAAGAFGVIMPCRDDK